MLEVRSPLLKRLHDDWDRRRNGREFPSRADFDPLELRYLVGNLSLIDVSHDPLRYRYRLHGTNIADRARFDLTGKEVADVPDLKWRKGLSDHFQRVIEQRRPVAILFKHAMTDERTWNCEALALPLSSDGKVIDMLITSVVWPRR